MTDYSAKTQKIENFLKIEKFQILKILNFQKCRQMTKISDLRRNLLDFSRFRRNLNF